MRIKFSSVRLEGQSSSKYTPTSSYKYLFEDPLNIKTIKRVDYHHSWAGVRRSVGHQGEVIYRNAEERCYELESENLK